MNHRGEPMPLQSCVLALKDVIEKPQGRAGKELCRSALYHLVQRSEKQGEAATTDELAQAHRITYRLLMASAERYLAGDVKDADGNSIEPPAALISQLNTFLKINNAARPGQGKNTALLSPELLDDVTELLGTNR